MDWLKWLDDAIASARHGSGTWITWDSNDSRSGADAERFLRSYGVRVIARQYSEKQTRDYGVKVKDAQAAWADALMRVDGWPVTSPSLGKTLRTLPPAWGVPVAPVGFLGNILSNAGFGDVYKELGRIRRDVKQMMRG